MEVDTLSFLALWTVDSDRRTMDAQCTTQEPSARQCTAVHHSVGQCIVVQCAVQCKG